MYAKSLQRYYRGSGRGLSKGIEKYIVLDASVVVDLLAGRDRGRVDVAEKLFKCIKDSGKSIEVFAPRLFMTEVAGVLVRFISKDAVRNILNRIEKEINTIGDNLYFKESIEIALATGSRGADSYYIGLAKTLGAVLVTNDKNKL